MSITLVIVVITSILSVYAFSNRSFFDRLKLNPYMVYHRKDYLRLLGHGVLHADFIHLIINMYVLYTFGDILERFFDIAYRRIIPVPPGILYIVFYLSALVVASFTTVVKHKHNHWYNSVGASGAVAAVVFATVFFVPRMPLMLMFIPIPIPGVVFALLYLAYSWYMAKRGGDNVNHDAHFVGSVYGFLFPILLRPSLVEVFIDQILGR